VCPAKAPGDEGLRLFRDPIAQADDFPDFSALVSMFSGFSRTGIDLSEGVLGIADGFVDHVGSFRHTSHPFLGKAIA
jgi:hypothetical protein